MKFDQLRIFLAVLEHESFSRAADDVGMSQSTVSFHVAALESLTGARLLDRGRGRVRATSQGALLARYARRILATTDEALRRLVAAEVTPSGHLHIAASNIVSEYLLPSLLVRLREAHPRVTVTASVSHSAGALLALRSRTCDFALVGSKPSDRSMSSAEFARDEIVLVGPKRGASALGSASELADLPLVLRETGSGTRSAVADLLTEANLDRPDILVVGSSESARRSVLAGLGYSFISRLSVAEDVRSGKMRIVALEGTPKRRSFYIVRLRKHTPSPAANALHELIVGGV